MGRFLTAYRRRTTPTAYVIGYTLAATDTPEVVLQPAEGKKLALVYVVAWQDATGSIDVKLRDSSGNGDMVSASIERDRPEPLINSSFGLIIDGHLQVEVDDTAATISAWALEINE